MNNRFLAITRALLGMAVAVTGFITRNAVAITKGAEVVHAAALDLAEKLAEKKVAKAWERYDATLKMGEMLRKQAYADYDRFTAACDTADSVKQGTIAERANLGIA